MNIILNQNKYNSKLSHFYINILSQCYDKFQFLQDQNIIKI